MKNQAETPTMPVNIPSIKNSHRQPSTPPRPSRWRIPKAMKAPMIIAEVIADHQQDSRIGSSALV
jgi:hypothetical protein